MKINGNALDLLSRAVSGDICNIEAMNPAGKKMRAKLNYVGAIGREFLLFGYPDPRRWGDMYSVLRPGFPVVGRYVDERQGEIIAFRTQVHSVVAHPVKMLCMAFPEQVQARSIREGKRIQADIPVEYKINEKKFRGRLLDISRGGGRLALQHGRVVEQDHHIDLSFSLGNQKIEKSVRVCSIKQQPEFQTVGLEFLSPLDQKEEQFALNLLWQGS